MQFSGGGDTKIAAFILANTLFLNLAHPVMMGLSCLHYGFHFLFLLKATQIVW